MATVTVRNSWVGHIQYSQHHTRRDRRDAHISMSMAPYKEGTVGNKGHRKYVGANKIDDMAPNKLRPSSRGHQSTWLGRGAGSKQSCHIGDRRDLISILDPR